MSRRNWEGERLKVSLRRHSSTYKKRSPEFGRFSRKKNSDTRGAKAPDFWLATSVSENPILTLLQVPQIMFFPPLLHSVGVPSESEASHISKCFSDCFLHPPRKCGGGKADRQATSCCESCYSHAPPQGGGESSREGNGQTACTRRALECLRNDVFPPPPPLALARYPPLSLRFPNGLSSPFPPPPFPREFDRPRLRPRRQSN